MPDQTMQQFTFVAAHTFEWREVETPKLAGAGEAIVRPLAVSRCDLDFYIATGAVPMRADPFALGHEIAGEVVEIGEDVMSVVPGDRVIVPFQINCGSCRMCLRGLTNACLSVPAYSAYGLAQSSGREWGGGLSDYVSVPFADAMLVKIPTDLSVAVAATLTDNVADGYRTVAAPLKALPGANVLVVGGLAQSIGLYAVQAARALGAGRLVYTDFDDTRLAKAKDLGAEVVKMSYEMAPPLPEQVPVTVDASNLPTGLIFALRSTEACGHCTGVASPANLMDGLPLRDMYMKGITYDVSRVHARAELDAVLEHTCSGCLVPADIITKTVPFAEAGSAIECPDRSEERRVGKGCRARAARSP